MTAANETAGTVEPLDDSAHYGRGGALGKTGFAWAVFEWARNPYYILIVIYIFAPYFAREVVSADMLASGELDGLDPETAQRTANAGGQAAIASITKWAGLVGALTAPFLGAALDRGGRRKPILAIFLGTIALLLFGLPNFTERSRVRVEKTPVKCFMLGLPIMAIGGSIAAGLM